MTVEHLIKMLSALPQNLVVMYTHPDHGFAEDEVDYVAVEPENIRGHLTGNQVVVISSKGVR